MKTVTFWTAITFSFFIVLESISFIKSNAGCSEESLQGEHLAFDTINVNVPVQILDFTGEELVITAGDTGTVK